VAGFYRSPNSTDSNNRFLPIAISKVLSCDSKYHLICGDFNFPEIDWALNTNPPALDFFMDCINETNLKQFVRSPTRGNNILDLVFCDDPQILSDIDVREPLGESDHNMVQVKLNIPLFTKRDFRKIDFQYSRADWDAFRSLVTYYHDALTRNTIDPSVKFSVEGQWHILKCSLFYSSQKAIPVRRKAAGKSPFLWKYPEIRKILLNKYKTYKKYKLSNDPHHKDLIRKYQKQQRKKFGGSKSS
jgi:hypothetical protein